MSISIQPSHFLSATLFFFLSLLFSTSDALFNPAFRNHIFMPLSKREVRRLGPDWQKSYPVFSMSLPFILFHLICEGLIKIITDVAIWAQTLDSHTRANISRKNWTSLTDTNAKSVPHEGCLRAWGHADWLAPGGGCPFLLTSPCQCE